MHIDHKQLVELLIETSGQTQEKIEKQVEELIKDINQAVADGEAYEIEGFGIFSGIGNRVLFIPSKELETEINFKYVGMEPIELDEGQIVSEPETEEDPFEALQDEPSSSEKERDPFAGLVEDFEEEESTKETDESQLIFGVESEKNLDEASDKEEEDTPGPESWGIDAHREGAASANKLISSLMGEEYTEEEASASEEESEETQENPFEDIFGEEEPTETSESEEESVGGLDAELASLMGDDASVTSTEELEAGLYEEDITDVFSEIEEEPEESEASESEPAPEEEVEEETIDEIVEEISIDDLEAALEETAQEDEITSEDEVAEEETPVIEEEEAEPEEGSTEAAEDEFDDFDDPFLDLDEDEEDEQEEQPDANQQDEVIPVITNITSGVISKKEEPKKEEEEKPKKEKKTKPVKKEPQPAPVWLWIILFLVIVVGGTAGLGYFGVLNIPGITPDSYVANNVQQPPVQPQQQAPLETQPQPQEEAPAQTEEQSSAQPQQQTPPPPVQQPISTPQNVPEGQELYGLTGVVSEAANDGYTIVLFSLSIEQNAYAKQQELSNAGYRAFVTPVPSTQYGTLWRVSIGQFASLRDAAIGAEGMPSEYQQSYFIKRITN